MKVALIQAPCWWTVDPPLGLAQVAGCLARAGHEVSVFDLNVELARRKPAGYENLWNWEQSHFWNRPELLARFFRDNAAFIDGRVEDALATGAETVGFSVYHGSQLAALELARRLKARRPSLRVVFGGQYLFLEENARAILQDPAVDAVVRGPGDEAFPALLADFDAPFPGAATKAWDGGPARPLRDLDRVPFADFSGFPLELYDVPERLPIHGSRGCVWTCEFCSSHPFWAGYSYMSGERLFNELLHHKRLFPWKCHFEFYDITANGNVKSLERLAELIIADREAHGDAHFFGWKINAIIRPEMTRELLGKLSRANCHDIIYGIESGSPRVLKAMNKPYRLDVAERVLKDTREAGITTIGNFMFGFPGETEEDFRMTLDFLRRNRDSFDRVYASATFTSLEQNSPLAARQEAFGVRRESGREAHHLYWESEDGSNDYLVRLDRYERFRALAVELGLDAYKGVNGSLEQDKRANLAEYFRYKGRYAEAVEHLEEYLKLDPASEPMRDALRDCRAELAKREVVA